LEIRGTPKYLTGSTPSGICSISRISCFRTGFTPAKKIELYFFFN